MKIYFLLFAILIISCNTDENKNTNEDIKEKSCKNCNSFEYCNKKLSKCENYSSKCDENIPCIKNFTCIDNLCKKDEFIYANIKELNTNENLLNKKIITKGYVSAVALSQSSNKKGVYIQDSTKQNSGLYIYFREAGISKVNVGDLIVVNGVLDNEFSSRRLRIKKEELIIENSSTFPFKAVKLDYFDDNFKYYKSMLVDIDLNSRFNLREILPQHYIFKNEEGKSIFVKDNISYLNHLSLNTKLISLKGIYEKYKEFNRIQPRSEEDIKIYKSSCSCKEYEVCLDDDYCVLDKNRCEKNSDCETKNCDLNSHYCKNDDILKNSSLEEWENGKPKYYVYGKALTASKEDGKKQDKNYSAKVYRDDSKKDSTSDVNFLSAKVGVDYNKSYTLKIMVYDNDNDVDARIYYEAYDSNDKKIGSGIPPSNDGLTLNEDSWVELSFTTNFINQVYAGPIEDLSYIRFGIRVNKGKEKDPSLPENYKPNGNGYVFVDSLSIEESNE